LENSGKINQQMQTDFSSTSTTPTSPTSDYENNNAPMQIVSSDSERITPFRWIVFFQMKNS